MNPAVKAYLSAIGRKGGAAARGAKKRTRTSGRVAALARWNKHRAKKEKV